KGRKNLKEGLYHLHLRHHTRDKVKWKSGVHKGSYIVGKKLLDRGTGTEYDHSKKGVKENISSFMVLPDRADENWNDPEYFFNQLEDCELYKSKRDKKRFNTRKEKARIFTE